jgi:hypothetical protein
MKESIKHSIHGDILHLQPKLRHGVDMERRLLKVEKKGFQGISTLVVFWNVGFRLYRRHILTNRQLGLFFY